MNLTQKISQMTPKGADLAATDLIEVSTLEAGSYVTKSITGQELIDAIPLPPSGLTVGTTPIASGTIGRVLFQGTGNVLQQSSSLFWDGTNNRLGIGTSTPSNDLHILSSGLATIKIQSTGNASRLDFSGVAYNNIQSNNDVPFYFDFYNTLNFRGNGGSVQAMRIVSATGNVLINTTTDAGFKFDVNGTARVSGNGTFGVTSTRILTIRPEDTTGAYGNSCSIRGGNGNGRLDFYSATNITELRDNIIILTSAGGPSVQVGASSIALNVASATRLQVAATTGNILINTTTDAGFRLDVNGTARVTGTATINDFLFNGNGNIGFFRSTNDWNFFNLSNGSVKYRITGASQGFGISDNGYDTVATSAMLQVNSTTKGFLPPRMTTTQRNAIASPAAGLIVYDTTLNLPHFFNGTIWVSL